MTPTAPLNYFLAIDGQPRGPLNAAMVLNLRRQGTIDGRTLICPEGGPAWVPLDQILDQLSGPAAPPPVPPVPTAPPVAASTMPASPMTGAPDQAVIRPAGYASSPPPATAAAPAATGYAPAAPPAAAGYAPAAPPAATGYTPAAPPMAAGGGMPSGEAARPRLHTPRQQRNESYAAPAEAVAADGTKGFRVVLLLAALGCFFLPWLEFSCANKRIMTQTGLQTITSAGSPDEEMMKTVKSMAGPQAGAMPGEGDMMKDVDSSLATGAALLLTVIALGAAFGAQGKSTSGMMAAMALGCLGVAAVFGFPLQNKLKEGMEKGMKQAMAQHPAPGSAQEAAGYEAGLEMGKSAVAEMVKVKFTPWFYAELGALGLVAVLGLRGGSAPKR